MLKQSLVKGISPFVSTAQTGVLGTLAVFSRHGQPLGATPAPPLSSSPPQPFPSTPWSGFSSRGFSAGTVGLDFDEEKRKFEPKEDVETPTPPPHPSAHVRLAEEGRKAPEEKSKDKEGTYWLMQPVYDKEYLAGVRPKHKRPEDIKDRIAFTLVQVMRTVFDFVTGYGTNMTEKKWLRRMIFLETIAGVPGMVGGMLRHLRSLRTLKRDNGWIHTLLEEAENERMHLLTLLQIREPGFLFKTFVIIAQGIFFNAFFISYLIAPRICHKFVGYLEEEAVKTYSHALHDLESGRLPGWTNMAVPGIAQRYWKMNEDATMRDLLENLRADEAGHSHVNHTFGGMELDQTNPFDKHSSVVP